MRDDNEKFLGLLRSAMQDYIRGRAWTAVSADLLVESVMTVKPTVVAVMEARHFEVVQIVLDVLSIMNSEESDRVKTALLSELRLIGDERRRKENENPNS